MASEPITDVTALNAAFDMARALRDMQDAVKRHELVMELQQKILAAQGEQASLARAVSG
jgi:hypothetical protein